MSFNHSVIAWVGIPLFLVIAIILIYLSKQEGLGSEADNKQYERWKDWATGLLTVITVLLAFNASLLGDTSNKWIVLIGGVVGFIGAFVVVAWFAREGFWEDEKNRPVLLRVGSGLFGLQAFLFLLAFVLRQLH